jgi:hypothetical protein
MVHIIRTAWSGTSGGPGLTQFAIDTVDSTFGALSTSQAQSAVDATRAYWFAMAGLLPDEIILTVSPVVDYYLVHNAQLAGSVSAPTPPSSVAGTSTLAFSMATGPKINLNTGVVRNGRRVRGSIYIVPGASTTMANNGMILGTARTTLNTAGNNLRTALAAAGLKLGVWSRPVPEGKPKGPRDGAWADVTAMEANEKLAILRGRRD